MARMVVLLVILFFVLGIDWDVTSARYADPGGRLCVKASVHGPANTVERFARGLNPNPD
jgi:hypothetical protein